MRYRDLEIRWKLSLLLLIAVGFAMGVAALAVLVYENRTFRPRALGLLDTQSKYLAEILIPPLQFDDRRTAEKYLATLRYRGDISAAAVFDSAGNLFATYSRDGTDRRGFPRKPPDPGAEFSSRKLALAGRILDQGRTEGYLWIEGDIPPLPARLPQYGIMFAVVLLSLLAVAALLAAGLKHGITIPLTALVEGIARVTRSKDYRIRVRPHGDDEIGRLTLEFNRMLEAVEQRDLSLSENRHQLQSIIDASSAIIYVKDLEGRYLLVNRQFERLFHVDKEEIVGKADYDLFSKETSDIYTAHDRQVLAAGKALEFEETGSGDEGPREFISSKAPLFDSSGKPYATCGISTDITDRKRVEDQLRQSQKMDAIGRLAGGIAHDFNNLLTAITGYSTLALQGMEPSHPLHDSLQEILKAGERAAGLTRQLLTYSRKQAVEPKPLNLNTVVSDMERMLRRLIGEDVDLAARLAPDIGNVMADRGQVEQILLNLVLNARDAMPHGGKLTLATRRVVLDDAYVETHLDASPGPHAMLSVSDSGIGMPPEVKARIFEPFFTTKDIGKGTGLGLSVVYGIVKQSGGSISVYSEPGMGTTFRIYFPEIPQAKEAPPEAREPEGSYRGSGTLLLVEDDELVRQFTRRILESLGYAVLEAPDGMQALEALKSHPGTVRMVITDVVMPVMGGIALAERIRAASPAPPILFVSGYSEYAVAHNGMDSHGEHFLQKPFSPQDLARKVHEVLHPAAVPSSGKGF